MNNKNKFKSWEISNIPFNKLLSDSKKIEEKNTIKNVKISILADSSVNHLSQSLMAALKINKIWPKCYNLEFNEVETNLFNEKSDFFKFQPDFVIIFYCTQSLFNSFPFFKNKSKIIKNKIKEIKTIWDTIKENTNAIILQNNFVLPINRPFGNSTCLSDDSFSNCINKLNSKLIEEIKKNKIKLIDNDYLASLHGKKNWLDERLWCYSRQALSPVYLPVLCKNILDSILIELGNSIKCVIVDLDNTLWDGVLSDDGINGIKIGQEKSGFVFYRFQLFLLELKNKGIILAACSKNNQDNVIEVLKNHPDMALKYNDFSIIVANYNNKVENIIYIQKKLNISFESMVFLDDSVFEREIVKENLPEITVPNLSEDPTEYMLELNSLNLFESRLATEEDLKRHQFYQIENERHEIKNKFDKLNDFIENLSMRAKVLSLDSYTLPRALQLVQRSNQFNLTTKRYSENDLSLFVSDKNIDAFCISLSDRLGDNGIITFVIIKKIDKEAHIDTWIMSCRVLGRKIENLIFNIIFQKAKALKCQKVIGHYYPTEKNKMVSELYRNHGFLNLDDINYNLFSLDVVKFKQNELPIKVEK